MQPMDRLNQFVNEYIGYTSASKMSVDDQANFLLEMISDLLVEDRLRTINLIELSGTQLSDSQKTNLLKGVTNAF